MVGDVVAGLGMQQNAEPVAIEHEPGQERRQHVARERDLEHRLRVRADELVMPAAERRLRKGGGDARAQALGALARGGRIVVDMGVIVPDDGGVGSGAVMMTFMATVNSAM